MVAKSESELLEYYKKRCRELETINRDLIAQNRILLESGVKVDDKQVRRIVLQALKMWWWVWLLTILR